MTKHTWIVLRKELRDALRDKKSVIWGLLLPLLLNPLLFWFMGTQQTNIEEDVLQNTTVALHQYADSDTVRDFLNTYVFSGAEMMGGSITIVESNDPMQDLLDGDVRVVLSMASPDDAYNLISEQQIAVQLTYNNARLASQAGIGFVQQILYAYNQVVINTRLAEYGIDMAELSPIMLLPAAQHSPIEGEGNDFLANILPLILLMMLATGSMTYAVDMFAGEKERKTLEPLLTTRAGRGAILSGKFLAVSLLGLLAAVSTMVGLFIGFGMMPDESGGVGDIMSMPIWVLALGMLLIVAIQLSFTAIHVILASWSRNIKEANTYGSGVMMAAMVPAFVTMFMGVGDISMWMMYVPVLNAAAALKMLLGGLYDAAMIGVALGTSALFLLILLFITTRMFNKEEIMLRM